MICAGARVHRYISIKSHVHLRTRIARIEATDFGGTLTNATVIQPSTAQAGIRLDILCNHHVICYCAMIDYDATMDAPTTAQDASCKFCILGPASVMPESAKAMAVIINEFGVGSEKALVMLKALHIASTV